MDYYKIIDSLEMNEGIFRHILAPDTPTDVYWRPSPESWNLLEIVCHLRDEEALDFRSRTEHILEYPDMPMPTIDPPGWVKQHKYAEQDYITVLQDFIRIRNASVAWLIELDDPAWDNVHIHPELGPMSASMLLTNWLAHDYLHIRQINRLHYLFLQQYSGVPLDYAGAF